MRRLLALGFGLTLAGLLALVLTTVAQGSDTYRFDAIFDDASGLITGQQVKIAGAEAGEITNVVVAPAAGGDRARVEATIHGPFRLHTDATCTIRPDGLISDNYLDCEPGAASAPLLAASHGFPPTVPVANTSEPVTIQDLFNIFDVPTQQRFQVLIDELGIATAGNGDEINQILEHANPTLQAAQRVIDILDRQDAQIATAISATNTVAGQGAAHIAEVRAFLQRTSGLTQLTADHSSALEQGIAKLPAFLAASTPALKQLDTVATDGTPLLANLHAAAPALNRVDNDIVPFAKLAGPALASLSAAVSVATPDAKKITPLVSTLSNYLKASGPSTANFSKLLVNLIQHGFSEDFFSVLYYVAGALSKYDSNSHMLSALLLNPANGACATYATTPSTNPACDAHFGAAPGASVERRPARHTGAATRSTSGRGASASRTATTPAPTSAAAKPGGLVGGLENGLEGVGSTISGITSKLGLGAASGSHTSTGTSTDSGSLSNLLNYLLK